MELGTAIAWEAFAFMGMDWQEKFPAVTHFSGYNEWFLGAYCPKQGMMLHLLQSALQPSAPPSPLPKLIQSILTWPVFKFCMGEKNILINIQFLLPRKKPERPIQITVCTNEPCSSLELCLVE